ncbi:MAG TPA: NAD(P)H-binding protein [Candidatus Acidoferrum sp.]|nr:NAD(P)H-binding protein [Candidatus Acidoferrum sp.]
MYVVTGATGNTGNVVVRTLLAKGQAVRAIGRNADHLRTAASGAEPFVCEITDEDALTKAFTGAGAVYAMIPPNMASTDYRAYQERVTNSIAGAIERSGLKRAVTLSSVGADQPSGSGPVSGLYDFEQRLNQISGLNVLHLRAGYFMENTLAQIGIIKQMGAAAGPLRADLKVPVIATRDIGAAAAEELLKGDYRGHQTRELLGQRDLTMTEVAAIIGKEIGKPGLQYVQPPADQVLAALTGLGMSSNVAGLLLEMAGALNSGHMRALEPRSARNTTPTSFETFMKEEFVPRYQCKTTAA